MLTRDMIPFGRENAVSRKDLMQMTGLSDREVRRTIAELRAVDDGSDMVIVSVSRSGGYYRTDNIDEIRHFVYEMEKRARNTFLAIRVARHIIKRLTQRKEYGRRLA